MHSGMGCVLGSAVSVLRTKQLECALMSKQLPETLDHHPNTLWTETCKMFCISYC